jgi:hypothetical protein
VQLPRRRKYIRGTSENRPPHGKPYRPLPLCLIKFYKIFPVCQSLSRKRFSSRSTPTHREKGRAEVQEGRIYLPPSAKGPAQAEVVLREALRWENLLSRDGARVAATVERLSNPELAKDNRHKTGNKRGWRRQRGGLWAGSDREAGQAQAVQEAVNQGGKFGIAADEKEAGGGEIRPELEQPS